MKTSLIRYRIEGVSMRFGLWNHGLSLKAMGCLYLLLSLARLKDWEYSVQGLVALAKAKGMDDGRHSIRTALAELESKRFLLRQRLRQADGQLAQTCWIVHDEPMPLEALALEGEPEAPPSPQQAALDSGLLSPLLQHDFSDDGKSCIGESVGENRLQHREITNTPLIGVTNVTPLPPRGDRFDGQTKEPNSFHTAVLELWNQQAPEHWVRIRELGKKRQGRLNGLLREFGSAGKALLAFEQSLEMARQEEWCLRPTVRLALENWLSNGKVRQFQEKYQAQEEPAVALLSGEQQEIAALAAQHPALFDGVILIQDCLHLRYSAGVQLRMGYPAHAMVATIGAVQAEIRYLQQPPTTAPCPL